MPSTQKQMLTYLDIKQALDIYDSNKKWRLTRESAEINALRCYAQESNQELSAQDLFNTMGLIERICKKSKKDSNEHLLKTNLKLSKPIKHVFAAVKTLIEGECFSFDNFEAVLTTKSYEYFGDKFYPASLALVELNQANILTPQNREAIKNCNDNPKFLASILIALMKANLLNPANRMKLVGHFSLSGVKSALDLMDIPSAQAARRPFYLTQAHFDDIIDDEDPHSLAVGYQKLAKNNILNPQTRKAVKQHSDDRSGMTFELISFHMLSKECTDPELFTPENIDAAASHSKPSEVFAGLINLYKKKILTPEYRELIINHEEPESLCEALVELDSKYKGTPFFSENIAAIKAHPQPYYLYLALNFLNKMGLYTPQNHDAVKKHKNIEMVGKALFYMLKMDMRTQEAFERVIAAKNPYKEFKKLKDELGRAKKSNSLPHAQGTVQGLFINADSIPSAGSNPTTDGYNDTRNLDHTQRMF